MEEFEEDHGTQEGDELRVAESEGIMARFLVAFGLVVGLGEVVGGCWERHEGWCWMVNDRDLSAMR